MARLVCSYSDDAVTIVENMYRLCMEEKKSGIKLSLNRVWDRTAALTGVSRSTANCGREEECTGNHRHLRRKCHRITLTRVLYEGPSPVCTP